MNKNAVLALLAGLLGGLATRYIAPPAAFAQDQAVATKEFRAQSFTLVDPSDRAVGTFTAEPLPGFTQQHVIPRGASPLLLPGPAPRMRIVLRDANGRELWSAGGSAVRPLTER
jgi:hypothetical protein